MNEDWSKWKVVSCSSCNNALLTNDSIPTVCSRCTGCDVETGSSDLTMENLYEMLLKYKDHYGDIIEDILTDKTVSDLILDMLEGTSCPRVIPRGNLNSLFNIPVRVSPRCGQGDIYLRSQKSFWVDL